MKTIELFYDLSSYTNLDIYKSLYWQKSGLQLELSPREQEFMKLYENGLQQNNEQN